MGGGGDPNGRGGEEDLGGVEGRETEIRMYHVTKYSIFNKRAVGVDWLYLKNFI